MLAPVLDAIVAQVILVRLIERQANKQLAIGDNRFLAGEFVTFRRPVTDKLNAFGAQFVVQHSQCVKEPFAVTQLVTHAIQRHNFILQIQCVQLLPDGFPVFLNFAEIPRRDTENQHVILCHQGRGIIFQIMQRH